MSPRPLSAVAPPLLAPPRAAAPPADTESSVQPHLEPPGKAEPPSVPQPPSSPRTAALSSRDFFPSRGLHISTASREPALQRGQRVPGLSGTPPGVAAPLHSLSLSPALPSERGGTEPKRRAAAHPPAAPHAGPWTLERSWAP
nr:zyxin-like [Chlorocebus sabaeus]